MTSPLISADELETTLAAPTGSRPVLLDIRWTLAGADEDSYRAGHLPGALFVDLDRELAGPPGAGGRHPLPTPADLERLWRDLGIDDGTVVVAYDATDSSVAARAWWLLRWSGHRAARVLDGGYAAWSAAGRPTDAGMVDRPGGGRAHVRAGGMPSVDIESAARAGTSGEPLLLDARAAGRYRGDVEPVDAVAGHIPGAVNLPLTELVDDAGGFRPAEEIRARFVAAGSRNDEKRTHFIASCGSGVTACHLVLAAEMVGMSAALYPGSYSEWLAAGRPVHTASTPSTG